MSPQQYCEDRAAPAGSSRYYSLLFESPETRTALIALYAFHGELGELGSAQADPSVTHTRLAWWHEELERAFDGSPRHPVTRLLADALNTYNLERAAFLDALRATTMAAQRREYESNQELTEYCEHSTAPMARTAAAICGYQDTGTPAVVARIEAEGLLIDTIRDTRIDAARNLIYLPRDERRELGIEMVDLRSIKSTDNVRELVRRHVVSASRKLTDAAEALPARDRGRQRSALTMAAIYTALADNLKRTGYRVLEKPVGVAPLRKLWIAWRMSRRYAQETVQQLRTRNDHP